MEGLFIGWEISTGTHVFASLSHFIQGSTQGYCNRLRMGSYKLATHVYVVSVCACVCSVSVCMRVCVRICMCVCVCVCVIIKTYIVIYQLSLMNIWFQKYLFVMGYELILLLINNVLTLQYYK